MFPTLHKSNFNFSGTFILLPLKAFNFNQAKILLLGKQLNLSQTSMCLYMSAEHVFENFVRKGEIAHNNHFLLFPRFLPFKRTSNLKLSSAVTLSLKEYKICHLGKN